MKAFLISVIVLISFSLVGCSSIQNSIERNSLNLTNKSALVECFSGGKSIYKAQTKGKVTDTPESYGFFFTDETGKFVEINADCIVTY
jgi:uncharacterized protein YcfL